MSSSRRVDVAAILTAVYRQPMERADHLAARVRARLALIETLGECARLLVEAPASAMNATLSAGKVVEDGASNSDVREG